MNKNLIYLLVFCFLAFLIFRGCGDEEAPVKKETPPQEAPAVSQPAQPEKIEEPFPPALKANLPPKIVKASVLPLPAYTDTDLRVEFEAEDPEEDLLEYAFQWIRVKEGDSFDNAEDLEEETGTTLAQDKFSRGDFVAVKITPSDWYTEGETFQTDFVIIQNAPPEITSSPAESAVFTDDLFTYQVKAQDIDNDPVTLSLGEQAPKGMSITPAGLISWPIPPGTTGTFTAVVKADDGNRGTCFQRFSFRLFPQPERKPPEEPEGEEEETTEEASP